MFSAGLLFAGLLTSRSAVGEGVRSLIGRIARSPTGRGRMMLCCAGRLLSSRLLLLPFPFPFPRLLLFPFAGFLDCLLYCALNTAVMLDFFFGRSFPSAGFPAPVFAASGFFASAADFVSFAKAPRISACASSSILLEALFPSNFVFFNLSKISCDFIFNSFASS